MGKFLQGNNIKWFLILLGVVAIPAVASSGFSDTQKTFLFILDILFMLLVIFVDF